MLTPSSCMQYDPLALHRCTSFKASAPRYVIVSARPRTSGIRGQARPVSAARLGGAALAAGREARLQRSGLLFVGGVQDRRRLHRGDSVVLREAVSTDDIETSVSGSGDGLPAVRLNGNGKANGNGAASANGNGATVVANGNGATVVANGNSATVVATLANGVSNGNGASKLIGSNGNGAMAAVANGAVHINAGAGVEGFLDPCDAGQLEACAQERVAERELEEKGLLSSSGAASSADSAQGTPYMNPGGRWSNFRKYSTFQRTLEIWKFAFVLFCKLWLVNRKFSYGKAGMTPERVSSRKQELAIWLREGLVKLGPTFIKIGQQFSTRVDVLAPEFVKELEKLQDNVPAFDSDAAIAIVEEQLGCKVGDKFEEFDPKPIAAASLGQVHLAKIDGERVVVKVQRPGLKELFDIDLKNIRVIAQWLQKVDPKTDGAARDWVAIYDECSRILYQEIDYTLEGENADEFRKNFADTTWVKVPNVMWEYTTSKVLTMEYVPGIKINRIDEIDALGLDKQRLARLSVESYLQQLLTHGLFHADPHPGNVAVDAADGGRLIYYDFGMMGRIPNDIRGGLMELFYGVYEKDPDRCLDALVAMGVLVPTGDRTAVRRTAQFFLDSFGERLQAQKQEAQANPEYNKSFKPQSSKEEKKAKRKQILSSIGEDLLVASADKPFRFPATFTFVVRSFTVLDGIGKGLDPRFDISEISAPYARGLLLEGAPQVKRLQTDFIKRWNNQNRAVGNLFKGPNMIEDVATTVRGLERGDIKLRVRALEAERALGRVMAMQKLTTSALVASTLVNTGTVLSVSAMGTAASASFVGAAVFGLMALISWVKVKALEKKELQLIGAA